MDTEIKSMLYKLRHKPTKLYFQPAKGHPMDKSNLSKDGKIYSGKRYPKTVHTGLINISNHQKETLNIPDVISKGSENLIATSKDDWEIVSYELEESLRIPY